MDPRVLYPAALEYPILWTAQALLHRYIILLMWLMTVPIVFHCDQGDIRHKCSSVCELTKRILSVTTLPQHCGHQSFTNMAKTHTTVSGHAFWIFLFSICIVDTGISAHNGKIGNSCPAKIFGKTCAIGEATFRTNAPDTATCCSDCLQHGSNCSVFQYFTNTSSAYACVLKKSVSRFKSGDCVVGTMKS